MEFILLSLSNGQVEAVALFLHVNSAWLCVAASQDTFAFM